MFACLRKNEQPIYSFVKANENILLIRKKPFYANFLILHIKKILHFQLQLTHKLISNEI